MLRQRCDQWVAVGLKSVRAWGPRLARGVHAELRVSAGLLEARVEKMQEVLKKYGNIGQVYQLLGSNNKLCGLRSKKKFSVP